MTKLGKTNSAEGSALKRLAAGQVSVRELVGGLGAEGFNRDEAVVAIITLQGERRLTIEEHKPFSNLASYAWSPLSLWFWASLAAIGFSLILLSVTSGGVIYLRYVFGSALVLFLPGYSLVETLYPKRELDGLTRLALSIGLSVALVSLTGLLLNYTPFGIRLLPVTFSIGGLTVFFLVLALLRKHAYYKLAKGVP